MVYHWSNRGCVSWFDIAKEISYKSYELGLLNKTAKINAISSKEYSSKVVRPKYSVLDSSETCDFIGLEQTFWKNDIELILKRLKSIESSFL